MGKKLDDLLYGIASGAEIYGKFIVDLNYKE